LCNKSYRGAFKDRKWSLSILNVSRVPIRFIVEGAGEAEGELVRIRSPRTVDAIVRALPLEGMAALWQEEVYFDIPVKMGSEKASQSVEKGTISYWPMGNAFCIFWGETQPYSPVNIIGNVTKNLELFKRVKSGTRIIVEKR
jgi:hypothetical protein